MPHAARTFLLAVTLLLASALPAQDFSHPDSQPAPQTPLIQKANDALASGDFSAALKILTSLNAQLPSNPQVLYDLGLTLEALTETNPAETTPAPTTSSSSTSCTTPSASPTTTSSSSSSSSNEQPTGAGAAPPTAEIQPSSSTIPPLPSAESCYRAAIAADPTFPPPHVALGLMLARRNRLDAARAQLDAALALPGIAPALKARALRALARLDLDGDPAHSLPPNTAAASSDLLAALQLSPEQPEDILLSAQIAETAADLPAAEAAYRRLLALPDGAADPAAVSALAHILLAEHRPADAEALLIPALAAHPGDPAFTAQLAQSYLDSADPAKVAQAVPLVEALHAAHPADPGIARLLARVYLATGHPDQADPLYAALLAAQPAHPDPTLLADRADALLRLHRPAEAEKLLQLAVSNPHSFPTAADFADAATHLAFAASEIDDPRTTLQALALRATVQPPSPASLYLEATANDALHQSSQAVEFYKQFLAAAAGKFPDQESQARQRLAVLQPAK